MTHDTSAIGRTTAFCTSSLSPVLTLLLSIYLLLSVLSLFRSPLPFFLFHGEEEAREESS